MKRILLTGRNGQVGWELRRSLAVVGEVTALGRDELNLQDPDQLVAAIRRHRPEVIVNAAAYTAVDDAEKDEAAATAANAQAPAIMAQEAKKLGALLVHYSTDYVFGGTSVTPYTEDDTPAPQTAYGRGKLAGERLIAGSGCRFLIFRTSWVYAARGRNFLRTMLRLAQTRDQLSVVEDQIGSPTWARDIAEVTAQILAGNGSTQDSGIFHLTATGTTSWCDFARLIVEEGQRRGLCRSVPVHGISTDAYPSVARRPPYSVLCTDKLFGVFALHLPDWDASVRLCLDEIGAASQPA